MKLKLKSVSALLALFSSMTYAHEIWLEPTEDGIKAFAGEYNKNAREGTPGMIEKLKQPVARLESTTGNTPLQAQLQADGIAFAVNLAAGQSVVFEERAYPLFDDDHQGKKIKGAWLPAARWVNSSAAIKPSLALDLVPTGETGEFSVSLRGKPLAKSEVEVIAQSGWVQTLETDEQGKIKITLPWQGHYVLVANHTDSKTGKLAGQAYRKAYYTTSLSFKLTEGLVSPPAPPMSKPNH